MGSQQKKSEKLRIFSERLKRRMDRVGIQGNQLAEKVELSPPAVSAWLRGDNFPVGRRRRLLAEALGCSQDYLFGEDVDEVSGQPGPLREQGPEYGVDWRTRAMRAEKQVAELRLRLSELLGEGRPLGELRRELSGLLVEGVS